MTKKEEEFVHFISCINDLQNAWKLLTEIKKYKDNIFRGTAFKFALIEYSKPYKGSVGAKLKSTGKPIDVRKLDTSYIPAKHIALHESIIATRDQFLAHSDLSIRDATLYVKNGPNGKIAGTVQKKISGTEKFSDIDDIIDLIEQSLDNMDVEVERLKATLPITP